MKQVLQSYRSGELVLADLPAPTRPGAGELLVSTRASVVSVGTERAMIEIARKSLVGKALARADWRGQLLAKIRSDGVVEAYRQAMSRLETPTPLGYSSAGVVEAVGDRVTGFTVGDRVACAGSGYASHAEAVLVPRNLCVPMPGEVSFEEAAFVALGGIALEAVRMAHVELGHRVAVIGLGMLGQLAVQLLRAAGCHVVGMDVHEARCALAKDLGCDATVTDPEAMRAIVAGTCDGGCDSVILLAATQSNEPIELAAAISRERARIVAAGMVGLSVPRKAFYEKELELVVSRAWGPGLYDPDYEDRDVKYPPAYVRWTAQANMAEFLDQVASGNVRLERIITHRFPIERALDGYAMLLGGSEPAMGVVLTYPPQASSEILKKTIGASPVRAARDADAPALASGDLVGIGLIGAGQFATGTLLPAMKAVDGIRYRGVATSTGLRGAHAMSKFRFEYATTDYQELLEDPEISLVFVLTRHGSHAPLAAKSLAAGKHTFVEKPLAIDIDQLREVLGIYEHLVVPDQAGDTEAGPDKPMLMVGFNRRFSPTAQWVKERFAGVDEPLAVHCTVNAGFVPADSWVHQPEEGAGRIIGELCHFVDLVQYLTGALPTRVHGETMRAQGYLPSDNVVVTLQMSNGAVASITYASGGDPSYPRERVEVFGGRAVGVIDNFKSATFTRGGRQQRMHHWLSVDRGHRGELKAFLQAVHSGGPSPVSPVEYLRTTLATFAIEDSLRRGAAVGVATDWLALQGS